MRRNKSRGYEYIKNPHADIQLLLNSEITNLPTLRERLTGSTLVAFDTEGVTQQFEGRRTASEEISELGIAVLRLGAGLPQFVSQILQFYERNDVEAFTIRMHERPHGPVVGGMTDETIETAGARLCKFISGIKGERILIGFGLEMEFKWMNEKCPSMAQLFTSWCDAQELVAASYRTNMPDPEKLTARYQQPALDKTMKALRISGWRSRHQRHGAAADAVKALAILVGLLCEVTLHELPDSKGEGISVFCYLPSPKVIRRRRYLHTARIRAADDGKLPLQTPDGLAKLFLKHQGLHVVGLNSRNEVLARDREKISWVSFRSHEALHEFIASVDQSTVDGVKLRVLPTTNTHTTKPQEHTKTSALITDNCFELNVSFEPLEIRSEGESTQPMAIMAA